MNKNGILLITFLIKQNVEKLLTGTPLRGLPPKNVHAHPNSIEILTYPLDLTGKSIERKLISIKSSAPLDLKEQINWK